MPPGGALIRVDSTGLCGSDINRIRYTETLEARVLGHEVAGEVAALAEGTQGFQVGDRVAIGHVHIPCGHCVYCRHGAPAMCRQFKQSRIVPGGYVHSGRARITHVFTRARVPFRLCVQELLSGVVEAAGEGTDAADAVWQIRELQWRTDGSQTFLIGTYTDVCRPGDDGVWRFARREFTEVLRGTF